jgi:hypothetical protein
MEGYGRGRAPSTRPWWSPPRLGGEAASEKGGRLAVALRVLAETARGRPLTALKRERRAERKRRIDLAPAAWGQAPLGRTPGRPTLKCFMVKQPRYREGERGWESKGK